jgi:hypothetical protein
MKIGVGVLLIKHETFQSLINLFSLKMLASWGGGGGSKKNSSRTIFSNFQIIKLTYLNLDF